MMNCGVCRRRPEHVFVTLQWESQSFGSKPQPYLSCGPKLGEAIEHGANGAGDGFVGMEHNLSILFAPYEANRQPAAQFAASGLVADAAFQPRPYDVQFRFAHGSF
jgi:hypothetical protein